MTRNTSVALGEHFINFVQEQLESGRYASTSEVVRAGLRLLEEKEAKVRTLQQALIAGEQSGEPRPFEFVAFKARKRANLEGR